MPVTIQDLPPSSVVGRLAIGPGEAQAIPFSALESALSLTTNVTITINSPGLAWVSVKASPFNAVGNGIADDTAAIQAAIDFAATNNISAIYMPSGIYKITSSLYLDPPGNLRSNLANPPQFQFSLTLMGDENLGNDNNYGTQISAATNNFVALYVGPGQGMMVKNLTIIGQGGGWHKQNDPNGCGVGLTGGASSRSRIENVLVKNFFTGFGTGMNGNINLCDANTFIKCYALNTYRGFWFQQTQNFINSLIDCQVSCGIAVDASVGTGAHIWGGNYSFAGQHNAFTISGVSALTNFFDGNNSRFTFTATISAPDQYWASGVYNAFNFATTNFGIVPCTMTNFNAGTNVATFESLRQWAYTNVSNMPANTDIQTELQACNKVFACELGTLFLGANITVEGIHVENQSACTLINTGFAFGSNRPCTVKNVFCNFDPAFTGFTTNDSQKSMYYASANFPWLWANACDLYVSDSWFGASADPVMVDIFTTTGQTSSRLFIDRVRAFDHNLRVADNNQTIGSTDNSASSALGIYDTGNFLSIPSGSNDWRSVGWGRSEFWGWRPAPTSTPTILPADLVTLTGVSLPAISSDKVAYPLMWGGQAYSVSDYFIGAPSQYRVVSNHHFYTYGQTLPSNAWSYKGQSMVLIVADVNMMFPGLGIILNDGSSNILYIVTGVYPGLGYITIAKASNLPGIVGGNGLKTSLFTGTAITQEPYVISVLDPGPAARVSTQFDKTTDTALANVTGLTATLLANRTYQFRAVLYCTCAGAGGAKVSIAGTATATTVRFDAKTFTGATLNAQSQSTTLGSAVGASTTAVDRIEIDGAITVNAAGTLTVQFAQNASSGTSSVLVGSTFVVRDIT